MIKLYRMFDYIPLTK